MVAGRGLAGRADKRLRAAARQAWLGARRRGGLGSQTSGRAPAWLEVPGSCSLPSVSYLTGATMTGSLCVPVLLAAWLAAAAADGLEQAAQPAAESRVQPMTASNWTLVMEGEWMLKL